jgi:hypothetical protein
MTTKTANAEPQPTPSDAAKAERTRSVIDVERGTVTVFASDGAQIEQHSIAGIPNNVVRHLALVGLGVTMRNVKDQDATMLAMVEGFIPGRSAKEKVLDPWRRAYMRVVIDGAARGGNPISEDEARQRAESLDKTALAKIKRISAVVAEHNRITGADDELP